MLWREKLTPCPNDCRRTEASEGSKRSALYLHWRALSFCFHPLTNVRRGRVFGPSKLCRPKLELAKKFAGTSTLLCRTQSVQNLQKESSKLVRITALNVLVVAYFCLRFPPRRIEASGCRRFQEDLRWARVLGHFQSASFANDRKRDESSKLCRQN